MRRGGETYLQRGKEEAEDYRYFPEPDLPHLEIAPEWVEAIRARLPELPDEKRERLMREYGLSAYDADVLTAESEIAEYYDRAVSAGQARGVEPKAVANWVTGELFRLMKDAGSDIWAVKIQPAHIPELIAMVAAGTLSTTIAKQVFEEMFATGRAPQEIVQEKGLAQISDANALNPVVERVIAENAKPVKDYLGGKEATLKFLVGQVMKATRGQANPTLAAELLKRKIESMR